MDIAIVGFYFALVMIIALRGRQDSNATIDDYFLGSRNLKWYSIAFFDHCYQCTWLSIFGHDGLCLPLRIGTGKL